MVSFAYGDPSACGSHLVAVDTNGDGADEAVLGEGTCPGRRPTAQSIELSGHLIDKWDDP